MKVMVVGNLAWLVLWRLAVFVAVFGCELLCLRKVGLMWPCRTLPFRRDESRLNGKMEHGKMEHGQMGHGKVEHGQMEHGQMEHGKVGHSTARFHHFIHLPV
jgi:hypothetical protein